MTLLDAVLDPTRLRLVGVDDDPAGGIRAHVIDRSTGIHVHCTDPASIALIRRAYDTDDHPYIPAPTELLCDCAPDDQEPLR